MLILTLKLTLNNPKKTSILTLRTRKKNAQNDFMLVWQVGTNVYRRDHEACPEFKESFT